MMAQTAFAAEQANEEVKAAPKDPNEPNMLKNIVLAGMIVAGIAVVFTANKKPAVEIAQPVISDLKKPKAAKTKVLFEDDLGGDFKSGRKVKGTKGKEKVIEQSESDGELHSDDGNADWDDKDAEEVDVTDDEPVVHSHSHGHGEHDEEEDEDSGSVEEVDDFTDEEGSDGSGETVSDEEELDAERQAARDELESKLNDFKVTIVWEDGKPSQASFMTLRGLIQEQCFKLF
jgi:hypothetical protein